MNNADNQNGRRHRRVSSADSLNELFIVHNRSTSAGASTSRRSPSPYIPRLAYSLPPDSPPSEDEIPIPIPADDNVRRRFGRNLPDLTVTILPPYPWAGNRHCKVLSMLDLKSRSIKFIRGEVRCEKCYRSYAIEYDLEGKFNEFIEFVDEHAKGMRQRAHTKWVNPDPLNCKICKGEKCVKPVIDEEEKPINWLFLFLGQMLGFCRLYQLRYFCTYNMRPRGGGKEQVLFRVYLDLFRQVDPTRTFVCF